MFNWFDVGTAVACGLALGIIIGYVVGAEKSVPRRKGRHKK